MSSKLMQAAFAALMLGATGLAAAHGDGRADRHGEWRHSRVERGSDRGPAPAYAHRGHHLEKAPYGRRAWTWPGYDRHPRHGDWHPARHSGHDHRHGYYTPHAKRFADDGDDITIIFRGRID